MMKAGGDFQGRHDCLLLFGALILLSCAPGLAPQNEKPAAEEPKAAREDTENLPLPFSAAGFEPPWSMEWDGSMLTISVGINEEATSYTDLAAQVTLNGWRLVARSDLELLVLRRTCLDLAGYPHDVDIDASLRGQRLVGCGDWVE